MNSKWNPFTIVFGIEPEAIIPRVSEYSQIISVFESEKPRTYSYVITGVRGCGKTVLLTSVQNYFSQKKDWIVLRLNPDIDLFESAISQLAENITVPEEIIEGFDISIAGFGAGISRRSLSNNETILRKMLKIANDKDKKVLVAIDEASNTSNLKTFAHSYQAFLGEGMGVFLLMTSLPENFISLSNSKNGTFLKRLPKIALGKLNDTMVRNAYSDIFDISSDEACELARLVCGYSFAYQVLGDLLWENGLKSPNEKILRDFDAMLDECVYTPIWSHTTYSDKRVLKAIADSEDNTVKSIRSILDMSSSQFSPYRDSLMTSGLIDTSEYGRINLTLPRFSEFVLQKSRWEL